MLADGLLDALMSSAYVILGIAIIAEVIATTALKSSESFSRLWPSVVVVLNVFSKSVVS